MKLLLITGLLSTISLSTTPCWADQVLAVVGDKKITLSEFDRKYKEAADQTFTQPEKKLFLEDLVRYELGLQEAKKKSLLSDPLVQEKIDQVLYKSLLEAELGKKIEAIQISEAEMQSYYKKYPEVRTSHILIEFRQDANDEQIKIVKKRAEEIYQEVKKSKRPFADLVKLYSDDSRSKVNGGDVGWQSRLTVTPSYYEAALKMKVGEIKGLVRTQFGFHIVQLTGKKSYEDAHKKSIRNAVFDLRRKEIFDDYFEQLKKRYKISVSKGVFK